MPTTIPKVQYEAFSFAVLRVEAFGTTGTPLTGHATGFIVRWKEDRYFVTNSHVVTQQNFFTKQPLHSGFCGLPGKLRAEAALRTSQGPATPSSMASLQALPTTVGSMPIIELPISNGEGTLDPGWAVSETADVAVYRLDDAHGTVQIGPVLFGFGCFERDQLNERVTARAMADCFITGQQRAECFREQPDDMKILAVNPVGAPPLPDPLKQVILQISVVAADMHDSGRQPGLQDLQEVMNLAVPAAKLRTFKDHAVLSAATKCCNLPDIALIWSV